MLTRSPAPFYQSLVSNSGALEVPLTGRDSGESIQWRDHEKRLSFCVEALDARASGRLGLLEMAPRSHVPADNQVVRAKKPTVLIGIQQGLRLAQGFQ